MIRYLRYIKFVKDFNKAQDKYNFLEEYTIKARNNKTNNITVDNFLANHWNISQYVCNYVRFDYHKKPINLKTKAVSLWVFYKTIKPIADKKVSFKPKILKNIKLHIDDAAIRISTMDPNKKFEVRIRILSNKNYDKKIKRYALKKGFDKVLFTRKERITDILLIKEKKHD